MLAVLKITLSSILIWAASEAGKRGGIMGALMVSLPLTSILTLSWVWFETKDTEKLASMSTEILWFLAPSTVLFFVLPLLLRRGLGFPFAMLAGIFLTMISYAFLFKIRS
ncbi:MAG: hypothetical protein KGP28_00995 [Bdellovibrionales bacterium]|nr:hypothetical protein [Bdellovibrionales bacterium]